jgi:hypothetical protein
MSKAGSDALIDELAEKLIEQGTTLRPRPLITAGPTTASSPATTAGAPGQERGLTGDALVEFINNDLLPHLLGLSGTLEREMIANIFAEIYRSRLQNGYLLRDVINISARLLHHRERPIGEGHPKA